MGPGLWREPAEAPCSSLGISAALRVSLRLFCTTKHPEITAHFARDSIRWHRGPDSAGQV